MVRIAHIDFSAPAWDRDATTTAEHTIEAAKRYAGDGRAYGLSDAEIGEDISQKWPALAGVRVYSRDWGRPGFAVFIEL